VAHRTVSGAPGDFAQNSLASGNSQSRRAIIHRTVRCTPDRVRCSKKSRLSNSAASGIQNGCSAIIHRTCPVYTGLSGATAEQRLLRANGHLQAHSMRARSVQKSGTPILAHRTLNSSCPVCTGLSGAPYDRQPHQRSCLVVGAINTPTTPPFMASKFSSFQPLYKS
jgi:hypothetical protein